MENKLNNEIDMCAQRWNISGATAVYKDGICYHKNFYGFADRDNKCLITEQNKYLISYNSRFILGLCIGKLIDERKIKLSDKLDKYIPEYSHGSEITMKQICLKQSGIPDFLNGNVMKAKHSDEEYMLFDDIKRNLIDRKLISMPWTFEDAFLYANEKELTCIPGTEPTDDLENMSETIFIREVIERASNLKLTDYVKNTIFNPIGISGNNEQVDTKPDVVINNIMVANREYELPTSDTFAINFGEAEKLLYSILNKDILSEKAWKVISTPATFGISIAFMDVGGMLWPRNLGYGSMGWGLYMYLDWDMSLGLIHLTNSELLVHSNEEGKLSQFRREFRSIVIPNFIFPQNATLVPYGKKNVWNAMNITIHENQREYMSNAAEAICIGYAYKHKIFILMEGPHSIGLIAFTVDKKHNNYYIESVLIDQKYQQRGFGRLMLQKGLDYLKSQGCSYITIGVNRFNVAAHKLYSSVGFTNKTIYEDFIEMEAHI